MAENPYVPPEKSVPEVTFTALLLGAVLSIVMSARSQTTGTHDRGVLFGSGLIAGEALMGILIAIPIVCLLYTSPSPRDQRGSRMPSSA